jgi:hypothetical protein
VPDTLRPCNAVGMRPGTWQAIALAMLGAACAAGEARRDPFAGPIRSLSPEELARAIDRDAASVIALRGKLTIELQESAAGDRRRCRGALAARNPWIGLPSPGLYVQGSHALAPTLFTLVSDADRFWLHVPSERAVYTGPLAASGAVRLSRGRALRLDARDLLRALFVEPVGDAAGVAVDEDRPGEYVVSVRREGRLERRLWVERRRFTVQREVFYDGAGREAVAIARGRHVDAGGRLQPERLVVQDRLGGGTVLLDFDALAVNPADLDARAFRPLAPPGAKVIDVAGTTEGDR